MSQRLLLLILALWLMGPQAMAPPRWGSAVGVGVFLGGYMLLVVGIAIWARMLSRQVVGERLCRSLRWFNRVVSNARIAVPLWLGVALFTHLGWGHIVWAWLSPYTAVYPGERHQEAMLALPALLLGTGPSLLVWMGLWWAAFPAERALREQSLLNQLDQSLPVHAPPSLRDHLAVNLRQQLLFMLLPILLILMVRDVSLVAMKLARVELHSIEWFENIVLLPAGLTVFILAPDLLRRVLGTRRLPDSPLRQRLETLCRRSGLRYREILLWHTHHSVGNAAVMGLLPRLRYILLSDLLLETLSDQQIEAVFAHEIGHIVHRHMAWYVAFFAAIAMATMGPGLLMENWLRARVSTWHMPGIETQRILAIVLALSSLGVMFLVLGWIMRRFERQADVFAARVLESGCGASPPGIFSADGKTAGAATGLPTAQCHVGPHGTTIFVSALQRVAAINNVPLDAWNWCHGTMASRMDRLRKMSSDPAHTRSFDRTMLMLRAGIAVALLVCGLVAYAAG